MALTRAAVLTLVAAYLGLFVGLIDANAVNLALPRIRDDLGGGIAGAQWTIDAYNITFAAALLTAGSLGDRFGRRRLLRIGLTLFIAASVACALAPALPALLAARAVQGLGAALMLPQGLAITSAAFPDPADRARSTAAWAFAAASSTALGPLLGGLLADTAGWRWIFWVNAPVGALALILSLRHLPESRDPAAARIDIPGQYLAVLGLATLTLVLVDGHTWPWQRIVPVALVAACALAAFVAVQRRSARPMLPLDLFGSRRLVGALLATFTMTFGIYGLLLVNSFAFQQQRGLSALATAVWFLPLPITYLALIPAANGLARRTSARTAMTAGLGLMAAGLLLYAAVGPTGPVWLLELSLVLAGAGLALNTGPAVSLAMSAMPVQRSGLGAGVVNLSRLLGITVGVAVLGSAMAAIGGELGVRVALVVGGVCQLAGAAAALRLARASAVPLPRKEASHA
ncbi:MFS transporter [Mycolicibacterium brisbanense]|uniref:Arabinose efflux permease family protein n=1 Tax=Mycolicibacterium brisbanense TaxID=146020 RepID=A0A100W492_9MYCO|nr:MFS transporter [Mycolicibacterium brisbanense]MCV7157111.1 MFS transporter [Mycolicibacterium brisbanense]GAS91328.1 arabinose efflux permease family protein [Mycolicibacterium brisbanense]